MEPVNAIIAREYNSTSFALTVCPHHGGQTTTRTMPSFRAAVELARSLPNVHQISARHHWLLRNKPGCAGWHTVKR